MPAMSLKQVVSTLKQRLPRDIGNAALDKARNTCPIQTGELYRSLYVEIDGFELGATVPYASDIEEGTPPVMVAGSYTGKWKRHRRRTKNGITTIRGHTKTFQGKKPVLINPTTNEWRTQGVSAGRPGTFFMKKALEASIKEQLEKVLESLGATKRKPARKRR